jgi:hypothetical protein
MRRPMSGVLVLGQSCPVRGNHLSRWGSVLRHPADGSPAFLLHPAEAVGTYPSRSALQVRNALPLSSVGDRLCLGDLVQSNCP